MKCPVCGSEAQDGKRFCADCGAALVLSSSPTRQCSDVSCEGRRRGAVIIAAVLVSVIVIVAAVLSFIILTQPTPPDEVLREWVARMNSGDARGAADLTIYSQMSLASYQEQVEFLERIIVDSGTNDIELNFVDVVSEDAIFTEDWYPDLLDLKASLQVQYGIIVEETVGVNCCVTFYDSGVPEVSIDSWPAVKVDSVWYLAYGV